MIWPQKGTDTVNVHPTRERDGTAIYLDDADAEDVKKLS